MKRWFLVVVCVLCPSLLAQTTPASGDLPSRASIVAVLDRERAFLESASPTRLIDRATRGAVDTTRDPIKTAVLDRGPDNGFSPVDYTSGVTYAGMLLASEVTGDARYNDFVAKRLQFIHDALPYSQAQSKAFGVNTAALRAVTDPDALDDCGAMCAALIKARKAHVGPDLQPEIDRWVDYISHQQFRLDDGLLARHRPQVASVWADDCYMSIPALAQAGQFDDAAKQMLGFRDHLYQPATGLFTHGQNLNQPLNPIFYWARANGWATMSLVELLDVLPQNHPARPALLKLLQEHLRALISLQGTNGLWHQLLDKPDSYLETSASAMFTFAIARSINRGWISPVSFGTVAVTGWEGLAAQVDDKGQVHNTCVGTTFASTNAYYYARPTSVNAGHGYGPALLAGAEMIRLVENPSFTTKGTNGAVHFIPK